MVKAVNGELKMTDLRPQATIVRLIGKPGHNNEYRTRAQKQVRVKYRFLQWKPGPPHQKQPPIRMPARKQVPAEVETRSGNLTDRQCRVIRY